MSFMPHVGQWSAVSLVTSGCIGHAKPVGAASAMSFMPHVGQRPGSSLTTSGCIGHRRRRPPSTSGSPMSISATKASVLSGGASSRGVSRSRSAVSSGSVRSTSNASPSDGVAGPRSR